MIPVREKDLEVGKIYSDIETLDDDTTLFRYEGDLTYYGVSFTVLKQGNGFGYFDIDGVVSFGGVDNTETWYELNEDEIKSQGL